MGIVISYYKNPYYPISIVECQNGFERCSTSGSPLALLHPASTRNGDLVSICLVKL